MTNTISAVIRTKGEAKFLIPIIKNMIDYLDELILVDNNEIPKHQDLCALSDKLKYFHYEHDIYPVYSKEHRENKSNTDPRTLAAFYNYSFNLSTCDFTLKLDDDDYWPKESLDNLRHNLKKMNDRNVYFFNGINILEGKYVTKEAPICGGRDHFIIGKNVDFYFDNDEHWERFTIKNCKKKVFLGITYFHLKFYSSIGSYDNCINKSNKKFLTELEVKIKENAASIYDLTFPIHIKLLSKLFPRLLPNGLIGCDKILNFYTKNIHEIHENFE